MANGVSGATGEHALGPLSVSDIASALRRLSPEGVGVTAGATERGRRVRARTLPSLPLGVAPEAVSQAGWGIVWRHDEDESVKAALAPLLAHRRRTSGDRLVRELTYRTGESTADWLERHGVWYGHVEPALVPFYLLLVGSPERMPFAFVHELDAEYCVGLLAFDTAAEYATYAESVVAYETGRTVASARTAVFFGTRHPLDEATALSADCLVRPLADGTPQRGNRPPQPPVAAPFAFDQEVLVGAAATRAALLGVLARERPPALLFSATHGMVWPSGHAEQRATQGALLCQDWPGRHAIGPEHYVTARDLPDAARVHGMVAFLFASFGGGTPSHDRFAFAPGVPGEALAPAPFVARLPQRMLAHPHGGALACISPVDRVWGFSIVGCTSDSRIAPFQRALARLMRGEPAGLAVQEFNDTCAMASLALLNLLEQARCGRPVDEAALVASWTERHDAGGYVLVGDPAVRLRIDDLVRA